MNVYVYQASLYCEDCGEKIRADLTAAGKAPADPEDEYSYDSENFPKGPERNGGGEADSPQHCDGCNLFLENPLTSEGVEYVREAVADAVRKGRSHCPSVDEWAPFYDIELPTRTKVILKLEAEIEIFGADDEDAEELARRKLDAFREAAMPEQEWGIVLYEAKRPSREQMTVCMCINSFGDGSHPFADASSEPFFAKDYALECLAKARAATHDDRRLKMLDDAVAYVEAKS
jgi:hypothetical protein